MTGRFRMSFTFILRSLAADIVCLLTPFYQWREAGEIQKATAFPTLTQPGQLHALICTDVLNVTFAEWPHRSGRRFTTSPLVIKTLR